MTNLNLNGNMTGFFRSLAVHPFFALENLFEESEEEEEEEEEEVIENRRRERLALNAANTPMTNLFVSVFMEHQDSML